MKKECKHPSICDGGYGKKRCCRCDAIIADYEAWKSNDNLSRFNDNLTINK